jgi:hypothetical protein
VIYDVPPEAGVVQSDAMIDPLEPLRIHQDGRCAICEEAKALLVDHDHETMLVRGLLCARCNVSEGAKSYPWLRAYRANPPAAQIGLVVRYGQHKPRLPEELRPKAPRRKRDAQGMNSLERLALAAADRPHWSPTLPDDPEAAEAVAEWWRILRAIGESVQEWRAEDAAEQS